jgi:nitroreductase
MARNPAMSTISITDTDAAARWRPDTRALTTAATAALRAPSIFNTQPWRWHIHEGIADLRADRTRQLAVVDPTGAFLTLSCGVALHHALTTLAAGGHVAATERLGEPSDPDLLARVRVTSSGAPDGRAMRLCHAMLSRHTDRRPYVAGVVPEAALDDLRRAAEEQGAHLHVLHPGQVVLLSTAAGHAADAEIADPAYRVELARWTHRPRRTGDGVPASTAVPQVPRPVPVREFNLAGAGSADPGPGTDADARYAILFTDTDDPHAWLVAGEALSGILLTATAEGLAVAPMSDVVEVPAARAVLRQILSGIGHPMLALRIGRAAADPVAGTPRRPAQDAVHVDPVHVDPVHTDPVHTDPVHVE